MLTMVQQLRSQLEKLTQQIKKDQFRASENVRGNLRNFEKKAIKNLPAQDQVGPH